MEPKKNPKYDVHKKRNLIFNFSLALSLVIVITAFNIVVPKTERPPRVTGTPDPEVYYTDMKITDLNKKSETPKPQKEKPVTVSQPLDFNTVTDSHSVDEKNAPVDTEAEPGTEDDFSSVEAPKEKVDSIFRIVETMPEPVGGYDNLFNTLRKNIRYPALARRTGAEGRVFVEFTINEQGELSDLKTITGIGYGCDEEAMRVVKMMKWKPGKQRGKPVKVRMVQQINFQLD